MKRVLFFVVLASGSLAVAAPAQAIVSDLIPVGGVLADAEGEPLTGAHDLFFALYEQESGGEAIWSDEMSAEFDHGVFAAYLGENEPLDMPEIVAAAELWLEIGVDDEIAAQRVALGSVPFAIEAQYCRQVVGAPCADGSFLKGWDPETGAALCAAPSFGEVTDVPADVADGDDDTIYTAGVGLVLVDQEFSVIQGQVEEWAEGVCYDEPDELLAELDDDYVNEGQTAAISDDMLVGGIDPAKISGTAWTSLNDGAGTGLDADRLDGFHALDFAPTVHDHDADYQPVYKRTVVVAPVGDGADQIANGGALLAALEGIEDASETNPYLLKIEPGVYKLDDGSGGLVPLVMKPWVDVEGSGQGATRLTAPGSLLEQTGTVVLGSHCELRSLTVENTGLPGISDSYATAIFAHSTDGATVSDISISVKDGVNTRGVMSISSTSLLIRRVRADCQGGDYCYPFRLETSTTSLREVVATSLTNSSRVDGIRFLYGEAEIVGADVRIQSTNITDGLMNYGGILTVRDSSFVAEGGVTVYGVNNARGFIDFSNVSVASSGGVTSTVGVYNQKYTGTEGPYTFEMVGGRIETTGATVYNGDNCISKLGNALLAGGAMTLIAGGTVTCGGVLDESYQFYASTCP